MEGIIGWLIGKLSLHGYFPCIRCQAVVHTYLRLFKVMMYNFCFVFLKLSQQLSYHVLPTFGGYYRNLSGIIGLFECVTKVLLHSNE